MKFRSLFLCTCLTVVPITALVSHRLPGGVVEAAGGLVAAVRGLGDSAAAGPPETVAERGFEPLVAVPPSGVPPSADRVSPENPTDPTLPPRTLPAATMPDRGLSDIQRRLATAGATSVECRPLPGHGGGFSATCRVGVDAEGSLFRMFQAHGSDPFSASRALLDAVELWRERAALRSAGLPTDVQVGR